MKIKDGLKKVLAGLVASFSGLLGAIGGAGKKETRRWGIPLTIASTAFAMMHHWTAFLAFALAGPMSIGYGLPGGDDKGSALGRFWYRVCSQHHLSADILTRTTIGLVYALILALIALFRGNWAVYAWTGPIIVLVLGITPFTWNKLGTYKLLGLDLLWGETVIYSMVSLTTITQLIFKEVDEMMTINHTKTEKFLDKVTENLRTVSKLIEAGEMRIKNNVIEMDAGIIFKTIYGDKATVTIAEYPKQGGRTPAHCHKASKEFLICIAGQISVTFGKNYRALKPGDCISLDKSMHHSCTALENDSRLIAICVPEDEDYKGV